MRELLLRRGREINVNDASGLIGLGRVARLQREFVQARTYLEEGLALTRRDGRLIDVGTALVELGHLARLEADDPGALRWYLAALEPLQASNFHFFLINCLGNVGAAALRLGAMARGLHLVAAAGALDELFQTSLDRDEREAREAALANARSTLGEIHFAREWDEGQAMTLEQAVAYALEEGK